MLFNDLNATIPIVRSCKIDIGTYEEKGDHSLYKFMCTVMLEILIYPICLIKHVFNKVPCKPSLCNVHILMLLDKEIEENKCLPDFVRWICEFVTFLQSQKHKGGWLQMEGDKTNDLFCSFMCLPLVNSVLLSFFWKDLQLIGHCLFTTVHNTFQLCPPCCPHQKIKKCKYAQWH